MAFSSYTLRQFRRNLLWLDRLEIDFTVDIFNETELGAGSPSFIANEINRQCQFELTVVFDELNQVVPEKF